MGHEAGRHHQIERTLSEDCVGDVNVARRTGVPDVPRCSHDGNASAISYFGRWELSAAVESWIQMDRVVRAPCATPDRCGGSRADLPGPRPADPSPSGGGAGERPRD